MRTELYYGCRAYAGKGCNFQAENIAASIQENKAKLKKLLESVVIDADTVRNLIESEGDEYMVVVYEDILEALLG